MGRLKMNKRSLDAHVAKVIAEWHPLTNEQIDTISSILYPGEVQTRETGPNEADLERQRIAAERAAAIANAKHLAKAIMACDVCNLAPEGHSPLGHQWEPGRAARLLGHLEVEDD